LRKARATGRLQPATSATASSSRLQEFENSRHRIGSGLSALAKVEHETWVADGIAAETGWSDFAPIQELLDFSK
jgi:hypothetical protein